MIAFIFSSFFFGFYNPAFSFFGQHFFRRYSGRFSGRPSGPSAGHLSGILSECLSRRFARLSPPDLHLTSRLEY